MKTTTNNPVSPARSLLTHFRDLPDPRINRTKDHDLMDVLVIAICTLLCAGETFNDMEDFGLAKQDWFKTFLALRNGIPSHDTFNRVFAALDPKHFLECFLNWTQSVRQAVPQEIVALDGKALRRALDKDQSVQYIVSAWAESNGLVWRSAVIYTLIQSCRRYGINPKEYLTDVLQRLPSMTSGQVRELLPHRWQAAQATRAQPR